MLSAGPDTAPVSGLDHDMHRSIFRVAGLALVLLTGLSAPLAAHPHVWVTGRSTLVFGAKQTIVAVRHSWTFDEMFSTMATQGLDADGDGKLSKEELAPLAQVNVESLSEYDFFTFLGAGDALAEFAAPTNYWLDYENGQLTLHFTLPVKSPSDKMSSVSELAVYDPTYFVAFAFDESNPVQIENKPAQCAAVLRRNETPSDAPERFVPDEVIAQLGAAATFGENFAERVEITCK